MALFGRKKKPAAKSAAKAKAAAKPKNTKQKKTKPKSDAEAVLAKMQAKKDAGDCPFC